jgi:diguanylate cyclase (GGDEF)-like protein/PAS domain S-box-containing protein
MNDSPKVASAMSPAVRRGAFIDVNAQTAIESRVASQQAALLEIMRSGLLARELPEIYSRLTEVTANTLDVGRVSIWRIVASDDAIEVKDLYLKDTGAHVNGAKLRAAHYPSYFAALRTSRVISAPDAEQDPRTSKLAADYLRPQRIQSMLDSAIWHGGERQGVVCVESVDVRREWTTDEQQFVGSIADLVALALENDTRRVAQKRAIASEEKFSQVFRLSPDCMVVTRISDGIVLEFSDSFIAQSGYSREDVVGRTSWESGMWVDAGMRQQWLGRGASEGYIRGMEAQVRAKSGEIRMYQISSERIVFDGQDCLLSVARDISESKRQERMLFEIAQAVASVAGKSFFSTLVGRLSEAIGSDVAFIGEIVPDDPTQIRTIAVQGIQSARDNFQYSLAGSPCETVFERGVCAYARDVAALFPRDAGLSLHGIEGYVGAPLIDSNGQPLGLIAAMFSKPLVQSDLAIQLMRIFASRASAELERRNQLDTLEHRANHDSLTGLQNRGALEKKIDTAIGRSAAGACSALLLLDLDRFKEINDTLGHSVGDVLLVKIAQRLAGENDLATHYRGQVARLGGDEFAIWLENIGGSQIADEVASRTLSAITAPFDIEGYRLEVGGSIGVALHPQHGKSASDLLRCADIAMYVAKRQGNGSVLYNPSADPYSPKRLTLMSQLGAAVRSGQLEVHYQPRMNMLTNGPSGFEALVRWRHPELGLLAPSQFIPLAELSDVIRPLTYWVLDEALGRLRAWSHTGRALRMAVNLSARLLMDEACPEQVQRLLEKHGIDPQLLELEITESAIIADPERASHMLKRIHEMGVTISIDDFGTGYSSLSHLKRLPLNALKIDVSFVTHMLTNEQDAVIVESTIALAHNLGLSVVAEGIEDAATDARLRALGCDEGQGYLYARPMPVADTTAWLATLEA